MTTYPHELITLTVASGVAWLMMRAGIAKNVLVPRRKPRTCLSCGRVSCSCN